MTEGNERRVSDIIHRYNSDPLEILRQLGGYYECPKDEKGNYLGPLVGYAGKDQQGKQYVGFVYANFALVEREPLVLYYFASQLKLKTNLVSLLEKIDIFCGAPMGGLGFALMLAFVSKRGYIYPEKKVTALATKNSREESELIWNRHGIKRGNRVAIVEDVLNNFSTTDRMVELIENEGGEVKAIVGILNRSLKIDKIYPLKDGRILPVISLVRKPIAEYSQEDEVVAQEVKKGNVVWKPKDEWPRLMAAIEAAKK